VEINFHPVKNEIIGLDQIGLHDNFFDLGGDSIKGAIFNKFSITLFLSTKRAL
jgi:hypothetical protein